MSLSISRLSKWFYTPHYLSNQIDGNVDREELRRLESRASFFSKRTPGEYIGFGATVFGFIIGLAGRFKNNDVTKTFGAILALLGVGTTFIANWFSVKPSSLILDAGNERAVRRSAVDVNGEDVTYNDVDGTNGADTSTKAAYRAKMTVDTASLERWGAWRILVDTMQNHVDEVRVQKAKLWTEGKKVEAKALTADVLLVLHDGRVISSRDLSYQSIKYEDVKTIQISDQGNGYDRERLEMIWSSGKTDDENAKYWKAYEEMGINPPGGKFGEGLKMVGASILKIQQEQIDEKIPADKRVGLVYRSQNWTARLVGKPVSTKSGQSTVAAEYDFTDNGADIKGSQTLIENPTKEMFDLIKNASTLVRDFVPVPQTVAKSSDGVAFETVNPKKLVYVRGYQVTTADQLSRGGRSALFNYDLRNIRINRDRDQLDYYDVRTEIGKVLLSGSSEVTINKLLNHAYVHPYNYSAKSNGSGDSHDDKWELEFEALDQASHYSMSSEVKSLWREAFYKRFGKNAMLCSSSDLSNDSSRQAKLAKENLITLNLAMFKILKLAGVRTDFDYSKKTVQDYRLGLSLDYEKERWGPLRIVLDGLQNHADAARKCSDTNGQPTIAAVEFQLIGKKGWLPFSELSKYSNDQICALRFRDESKDGYSHGHLAQFGSEKRRSTSLQVGEFGEGIKIASAASLRLGLNITLKSQDWVAEAYPYNNTIKDSDTSIEHHTNLAYHIYQNPRIKGSETIIYLGEKVTSAGRKNFNLVLDVAKDLRKYVLRSKELGLHSEDLLPLHSNKRGYIISSEQGDVYVKDFYITSEEKERLIFGYNFMDLKTNRDRDIVSANQLIESVGEIISNVSNKELIKKIIEKSVKNQHGKYHEFQDISAYPGFAPNKKIWAEVFKDLYGNKAVLASGNGDAAKEAQYMGFQVINANTNIAKVLHSAGILFDNEVIAAEYDFLQESDLTSQERAVLDIARYWDQNEIIFPASNIPTDYKVFEVARNKYDKTPIPGILGCADIAGRRHIAFKRSVLHDPINFLETYLEEKAHQLSGAPDGSREHFNKACDSAIWLIFGAKNRVENAIRKLQEAFTGFDVSKIRASFDALTNRAKLVYTN